MNQLGLFENIEDHDELEIPSSSSPQMGLIFYPTPFGATMSSTPTITNSLSLPFLCNQSATKISSCTLTTTSTTIPSSSSLAAADSSPKDQDHFGGSHQLLSLQRSTPINLW